MSMDQQTRFDLAALAAALRGENPALLADPGQRLAWAELIESILPSPSKRERQNADKVLAWQLHVFTGMKHAAAARAAVAATHPSKLDAWRAERSALVETELNRGFLPRRR